MSFIPQANLVMIAEHATASQVERVVRSYRGVLDYEEEREAANERHAKRFFRLDPALQAAHELTGNEPVDKGGPAGPSDRNLTSKPAVAITNADALVMMAESFLANGPNVRTGGDRHAIVLNVDIEVLSDHDGEGTCELDGGPSIALWCTDHPAERN